MQRAAVRAQAKLNLFLHVLARETSGYHQIETLFHRVDLADDVLVTLRPAGERTLVSDVNVGAEHENLAYRAADLYCADRAWHTGFHIELTKRIPAGGGLGGGSADAAAVLRALDALAPEPVGESRLLALALQIGADVPFLSTDAPMALAWGRGDRLLALDPLPVRDVALIFPGFPIATAAAYGALDLSGQSAPLAARPLRPWDLANWERVAPRIRNDFTAVTGTPAAGSPDAPASGERAARLRRALAALRAAGALAAEMSGTGSTLFGIFAAPPDVEALSQEAGAPVAVTRTATHVEPVRLTE